jgi:hypothetical protein
VTSATQAPPVWIASFLKWLTPRRLRAQATILALCLWGVCAADFGTPSVFDRAGNIKFQDFLPLYISGRLISQHRADEIYDKKVQADEVRKIIGQPTRVEIPYLYGPQVGLIFAPLAKFSFATAAEIWAATSLLIYFACIYAVWRCCGNLAGAPRSHPEEPCPRRGEGFAVESLESNQESLVSNRQSYRDLVVLASLAFPPLFHVFVRAQISSLVLACFTAALLAFRGDRQFLAGIALGLLVLKPQFLVAIPFILLLAGAWRPFLGLVLSAAAQLMLARLYFGSVVMRIYSELFRHPTGWINAAELNMAPIQMHSLRSFWTLLIPSPTISLALYTLTSILVIAIAVRVWKLNSTLGLRFAALTLAAILVNPHLFIYDLLALAPVLLLVVDWSLDHEHSARTAQLLVFSYLAFMLPLFGPLSRWTHLQVSVLAFVGLLWIVAGLNPDGDTTHGHKLALSKSPVV